MKTSFISAFYLFILSLSMLSCKKDTTLDNNNGGSGAINPCGKLALIRAHATSPITKGDELSISADTLKDAVYQWYGPSYYQSDYQNNLVDYYATYKDRGWYYVRVSLDGCNTDREDSVYVNVKLPQGTPACSPVNNTATFSSLGDQDFYYITFGSSSGNYEALGNSSNGDLTIRFNDYFESHDLEDGIYTTTGIPLISDYEDLDRVYISDVNQDIFWTAGENQNVYVTHVNGKQVITFCGLDFSGSFGGPLYHTTVSGKVTQP